MNQLNSLGRFSFRLTIAIQLITPTTIHPASFNHNGWVYSPTILLYPYATNTTANATGRISPLTAPASINSETGFFFQIKMAAERMIKTETILR